MANTKLLSFIIGSSLIPTFISFSYICKAYKKANRPSDIPYELFPIFIPFMFGLCNIISVYLQNKYNYGDNISFIVGGLIGVIFSLFRRFLLNLPVTIFNFTETNQWMVHIIAFFLYGSIFRVILQSLNKYFNLV